MSTVTKNTVTKHTVRRITSSFCLILSLFGVSAGTRGSEDTVALTLHDCILTALEGNSSILVQKLSQQTAISGIEAARAQFDPTISASTKYTKSDFGNSTSQGQTSTSLGTTESADAAVGVQGELTTGTTYSMQLDNLMTKATNPLQPSKSSQTSYDSGLSLSVAQPLLRGAGVDVVKAPVTIARRTVDISLEAFRQTVMDVLTQVETLYWNLVYTRASQVVTQQSIELAKQQLIRTQSMINAGKLANIELLSAQAAVALQENDILLAEQAKLDAEDSLKQALWLTPDEKNWQVHIIPADSPDVITEKLDESQLYQAALLNRPDYLQAQITIAINELTVKTTQNGMKPDLKLTGAAEVNGDDEDYSANLSEMAKGQQYTVAVGLNLGIPWFNRGAHSAREKARLALEQSRINIQQLDTLIRSQIRSAVRGVTTAQQRIEANKSALSYSQSSADAEQRRFELGRSTQLDVNNALQNLKVAANAELKATIDYRLAVVKLRSVTGGTLIAHNVDTQSPANIRIEETPNGSQP